MAKVIEVSLIDGTIYTFTEKPDDILKDFLKLLEGKDERFIHIDQGLQRHIIPRQAIVRIVEKDK